MIRKIFEVRVFTADGNLEIRCYAANRKTANRIAKPYGERAEIRLLGKDEWYNIRRDDIERL